MAIFLAAMIRAGFWRRALALVLDQVIVFVPWYVTLFVIAGVLDARGAWDSDAQRWMSVAWYIPWMLYSLMEITRAATPGKMILGMRIVRPDGSPADRWMLVTRYIGKQYPFLFYALAALLENTLLYYLYGVGLLIVAIGCLYALGEEKRTWHDGWAGTAVDLRRRAMAATGFPIEPR